MAKRLNAADTAQIEVTKVDNTVVNANANTAETTSNKLESSAVIKTIGTYINSSDRKMYVISFDKNCIPVLDEQDNVVYRNYLHIKASKLFAILSNELVEFGIILAQISENKANAELDDETVVFDSIKVAWLLRMLANSTVDVNAEFVAANEVRTYDGVEYTYEHNCYNVQLSNIQLTSRGSQFFDSLLDKICGF